MTKRIHPTLDQKDYDILKTIPEEKEIEFTYDNYNFYYSKTCSKNDMTDKNYKLIIWTYNCANNTFNNLQYHVVNSYKQSIINEEKKPKIFINKNGIWKGLLLNKNRRKIISVVMKDNKNLEIKKTLDHFIQSEEWYNTHGISYKKVFLFYGPAGTGKSSMIKAMSNELQRHIHYLNLSLVTNDNKLNNLMANINFKETILVIEDIDSQIPVFCKRFKTVELESTYYECNSDPSGVIAYGNLMNTIERYNEG